jgi:hypothetical protein
VTLQALELIGVGAFISSRWRHERSQNVIAMPAVAWMKVGLKVTG